MLCNQCAGCALAVTTAAADTAECSGGVIAVGSEMCIRDRPCTHQFSHSAIQRRLLPVRSF